MEMIDQTANQTHNFFYIKKTLQFLVPISIISFLVSYYYSLFSLIFHPLHFYYSIFPSLALDRKCMFLLCNGILAFLAKNLKLNTSSALNHGQNLDDELKDGLVFHENAAYVEYVDQPASDAAVPKEIEIKVEQEENNGVSQSVAEEEIFILESEEWGDDEDDEDQVEGVEESPSVVSDMRVSTEELNKKFDEFIRKMKEEIRIEARQQYLIAV